MIFHTLMLPGSSLLARYSNSASTAVMVNFPEHHWHPWLFKRPPREFWLALSKTLTQPRSDREAIHAETSLRSFVEWVAETSKISSLNDWQLQLMGSESKIAFINQRRLDKLGGLSSVLARLYPNHRWSFTSNILSKPKTHITSDITIPFEFTSTIFKKLTNKEVNYDHLYSLNTLEALRMGGKWPQFADFAPNHCLSQLQH